MTNRKLTETQSSEFCSLWDCWAQSTENMVNRTSNVSIGTKFSLSHMGLQNSLLEASIWESRKNVEYITDNLLPDSSVLGKLWVRRQKEMERHAASVPSSSNYTWGKGSIKTHRIWNHCISVWKPREQNI